MIPSSANFSPCPAQFSVTPKQSYLYLCIQALDSNILTFRLLEYHLSPFHKVAQTIKNACQGHDLCVLLVCRLSLL